RRRAARAAAPAARHRRGRRAGREAGGRRAGRRAAAPGGRGARGGARGGGGRGGGAGRGRAGCERAGELGSAAARADGAPPPESDQARRDRERMAKIRAYKIAEELGIDRNDFVEKAKSVGVDLANPMASIDEEVANELRQKLGGFVPGAEVIERRVEAKGGSAVIRRRKRAPEPAPAPPVVETPAAPTVAEAPPAVEEPAPAPEPTAPPEPEPEPVEEEPEEIAAEATPRPAPVAGREEGAAAEPRPGPDFGAIGAAAAAAAKGKERKRVREVVNLREQEQLARQATSRLTRRPVAIDPRSMQSPRRRKRDKVAPAARPAAAAPKAAKRIVRAEGQISVAELARQLGAKAAEVQGRLMALGTMASVNQQLDLETARRVATHYGFEVQDVGFQEAEVLGESTPVAEGAGEPRPPIVTVMGHVDH